ncbi:serine/threonine-protein kinase [Prosthecobacter sp.]|uniref:serine/threonine-protein kinase n=1 Tax=Prosthecobacter sp. TaxID=1965333 RepID=UPI001D225DDB|nr:serine/threonine-protein kinase [Prosthecobacter sp.]MCB1277550.1 serine/threonine protein kinase [Prosthecobacter sp.]
MQPANDHGGEGIKFEPFVPPSTQELDELIPGYKFVEFIERGGMGAVYKAVQKSLNRTVAVKLLPQVHRNKESFAERFKREAHALAQLNHPHIIAVHDFGETPDGQMFYAMEYVSGMDLQHLLKRDPPEPRQILRIITQVCEALQFAHERGIVHRDIKPANILIDERGNVKVADFGLAKVVGPQSVDYTATGTTLGTPDYIAPEALDQSRTIDHRADIYSLGVMIYELFTGHVPKGMWEPPSIRSGADKGIDAVVSKAMQNNPEKRYQHVSDMTQVLEKLFKNSDNWKNFRRPPKSDITVAPAPQAVRIPTDAETIRMQSRTRKKRWMGWAAGILLLGGGGAAWQAGWLASQKTTDAELSQAGQPAQAPPAPEQMKLAEWVFAHDGFLNVQTDADTEKQMGDQYDIWYSSGLPKEPFTIWRVSFAVAGRSITEEADLEELVRLLKDAGTVSNLNLRGLRVPVAALGLLGDVVTITNLDLTASPVVTVEAVPFLAASRQLKLLRVGGTTREPLDPSFAEEMRLALPNCTILQN